MTDPRTAAELRDLAHRYARLADDGDGAGLAALFTPDGRLVIDGDRRGAAPGRRTVAGPDAIVRAIDTLGTTFDTTFHAVSQHTVEVASDGTRATGQTYCTAHHLSTVDGQRWDRVMLIRYADTYQRVDGAWRFATRTLEVRAEYHLPLHPPPTAAAAAGDRTDGPAPGGGR